MKSNNLLFFFTLFLFFTISLTTTNAQVGTLKATMSLVGFDSVMIPYQNGFPVPSFQKQDRTILNLKGTWKKQRFVANHDLSLTMRDSSGYADLVTEAANRQTANFDDASWVEKQIPGVENTMHTYPGVPEFYEDGMWYRYKFNLPTTEQGKMSKLMFYSVNYIADVWVNGIYVGYHEGGYTPFAFDVTGLLNETGSNTVAIRVDNIQWGTRKDIVPYSKVDWFNYSGIIHDVYLEFSDKLSVLRADVVPLNVDGKIQTTVTLANSYPSSKNVDITFEVYKANITNSNIQSEKASAIIGSLASISGETAKSLTIPNDSVKVFRGIINVTNPALWSPKTPNLYVLKVIVKENGVVKDQYFTQFGVRIVKTGRDKLLLNGHPVFFTGVARHEDHPLYGRSIPIDTIYTDLLKVKSVNANMLRTAHYPNHIQTYLLADRLGIVTVEEIPVWQFDETFPWAVQNSARHIHEQMFREMVFKDYNRPSILLWSTQNECLDVANRQIYIQRVNNDLNTNYKDGRMITQSAAADRPGPEDPSMDAVDVMGWTMYFGIFHGSTYYTGTKYFLVDANIAHPAKPILDTEFGYWSSEDGSSAITQNKVFTETWPAFAFRAAMYQDGTYNPAGFLMGTTWWCIFDWYRSTSTNGYQSMGLFDMKRTGAKPVATTLKNAYAPYFNAGGLVPVGISPQEGKIGLQVNEYFLGQNFPNPFNPQTLINYSLPIKGRVIIKLYNIAGEEIAALLDEEKNEGSYSLIFDASKYKLSSGVYFYRMITNNFTSANKLVLLK